MKSIPELKITLDGDQAFLVNKMTNEIGKPDCKAVCFRMDGTLVSTPFSERQDLFLFMEEEFRKYYKGRKSFSDMRIYAESNAPKELEKIYDFIMKQTKISADERDALMKLECRLIEEFVFPRNFGRKLFDEARKRKKKIIIAAETVYPRSVVVNILDRCGYIKYSQLVISNELEAADMYEAVIAKSSVTAAKILSIGGNVENDVEKPIMNGSKALLLTDTNPLMIKSGRLRGFIQSKHIYDYDSFDFAALHLALGLYGTYMFDIPKSKVYQSDFCASAYMTGFIVFGTLRLAKDFSPTDLQKKIIAASTENEDMKRGADDFEKLFSAHFSDISQRLTYKGFSLPFEFFSKHGAAIDRNFLSGQLDDATMKDWESRITEPKVAPVSTDSGNSTAMAKLADKMFPPGTKVRNITDNILAKMKQKVKL